MDATETAKKRRKRNRHKQHSPRDVEAERALKGKLDVVKKAIARHKRRLANKPDPSKPKRPKREGRVPPGVPEQFGPIGCCMAREAMPQHVFFRSEVIV